MGRCNRPSCLINQLFPKSFHSPLEVPCVADPVPIDLEEFDARDGWILESIIDGQGGTEVSPLLV